MRPRCWILRREPPLTRNQCDGNRSKRPPPASTRLTPRTSTARLHHRNQYDLGPQRRGDRNVAPAPPAAANVNLPANRIRLHERLQSGALATSGLVKKPQRLRDDGDGRIGQQTDLSRGCSPLDGALMRKRPPYKGGRKPAPERVQTRAQIRRAGEKAGKNRGRSIAPAPAACRSQA